MTPSPRAYIRRREMMDPRVATAIILALCLVLIVLTYTLGIEVGQAAKMQLHPGYERA